MKKNKLKFIVLLQLFLFLAIFINDSSMTLEKLAFHSKKFTDLIILPNVKTYLAWDKNGTAICTTNSPQSKPQICSDSSGGAIICWTDYKNNYDIYVQRINSTGNIQWISNGTVICNADGAQTNPQICSDGLGGAIICWNDDRNGGNYDIYAQRINSTGSIQWIPNGTVICNANGIQTAAQICSDNSGGAIITWHDSRGGSSGIYTQRINYTGSIEWTPNGTVICNAILNRGYPKICSDGSGGAIICWTDNRNTGGNYRDIYAQRINSTGSVQWTPNGTNVFLGSDVAEINIGQVCGDGNGSIFITNDYYWSFTHYGYITKVNFEVGNWSTPIGMYTNEVQIKINCDENGDVIAAYGWYDDSIFPTIYYCIEMIKINSTTGVSDWEKTILSGEAEFASIPVSKVVLCGDGDGGAFVTWPDELSNYDIYAQWINSTGDIQWSKDVAICTAIGEQNDPEICSDDTGGAIIVWVDSRNGNGDIYAQHMTNLTDKAPTSDHPNNIITSVTGSETINWTLSDDFGEGLYRVWANDTNGNFYLWKSWSQWFNNTVFYVDINRSAVGIYNYTIEYYDNWDQFGIPDTVIVTITGDGIPTSNHPDNFSTSRIVAENITWTLYDDFGIGQYRVWVNDTNNNYYIWKDWSSWTNGASFDINVNRTALGLYNYTIEYHDFYYQFGIPDTVFVTVEDNVPTSNQPANIITNARETKNVTWTLYDDCGPSYYRVWTNDTKNNYYILVNWNTWFNNTPIDIEINRSAPGIFNYTIEFNDTYDQFNQDTVIVTIIDLLPTSNQPGDIQTTTASSDAIYWRLYDDFGPGKYQVWANDSNDYYYLWIDWASWANNTFINVPINRSTTGRFNYTIEFNTSTGQIAHDSLIVTITTFPPIDQIPTSSHPQNIITPGSGSETIKWTLYDDIGQGYYRVWVNDTNGVPYIWVDWTMWTNGIVFNVPINYTLGVFGVFNYTIEYNDSNNQFGIPDTVIVTIIDSMPTCNKPGDVTTTLDGFESIEWILYDEYGPGYYRIWVNDSIYQGWTDWTNGTSIIIAIKRTVTGIFNYTIEFNSSTGQITTDTVFVVITGSQQTESPNILLGPQGSGDISDFLLSPLVLAIIIGIISAFFIMVALLIKNNKKIRDLDDKISKTKISKTNSKKLKDTADT